MQFLETIEGKTGEELASAVLKFLLVNSSTMRHRFVQHFRGQLPASRTPTFRDGIICQCEYPTKDGDLEGSIDILIRAEPQVVLAIENKFWAAFTDDQPRKYVATLKEMAKDSLFRIVLVFPEERHSEIEAHVTKQGISEQCILVHWQKVRKDLEAVATCERAEIAAVASFLYEYVGKQVRDITIDIEPARLVGSQVHVGNDFHYDFLYKLKNVFPNPERLCPAANWFGFHFRLVPEKMADDERLINKQWFGFAKTKIGVVLGLSTGIPKSHFRESRGLEPLDGVFANTTFFKIPLDGRLNTTPEWKEWLDPILSELKAQLLVRPTPSASSPAAAQDQSLIE